MTYTNIMNVLRQQSYIGIIATAMTFVIMTGNIDLSVGSLLTLLAVICAQLTQYGPWVAIIVTLLLGLVCGAINGLFVAGMKLNAFITTIAMGSVYGALTLIIAPVPPLVSRSRYLTCWAAALCWALFPLQFLS